MTLPLSRGLVAVVDADDHAALAEWKWTAWPGHRTFYAGRYERASDGRNRLVLMHRLLMNPPTGMIVDHVNGDGTDNRRSNLRVATQRENMMNRRPQLGGTSPLKGVWHDPTAPRKPWRSAIRVNGKLKYLGRFAEPDAAAAAYAKAAAEHFGNFSRTEDGSTK